MKNNTFAALAAAGLFVSLQPAILNATDSFDTITVTATNIEHEDTDAPYASEVHTLEQINQSGADSLYDYLDKQTSLVVLPSYGNSFSQRIDMRGYGINDGYQNIVVNLDGRRLNNIDMSPQLLSAIPLESIDRIEIVKGSGSVANGDGAMAGVINIYTRPITGAGVSASAGNYGVKQLSAHGGLATDHIDFSLYSDQYWQDGFSDPDVTGERDKADKSSLLAKLNIRPTHALEINLGIDSTAYETRYPGALTLAEYKNDPAQNGNNTYTLQNYVTDSWSLGSTLKLMEGLNLKWEHSEEDKHSDSQGVGTFGPWTSVADYHYQNDRLLLSFTHGAFSFVIGGSQFDGKRIGSTNTTHKDNSAQFIQADYLIGDTLLSLGTRSEYVEYRYVPNGGTSQKGNHNLDAWDFGVNHRIDDRWSVFANVNQAYQAPDIDRFFTWGGGFNGFIVPAEAETVNAGVNLTGEADKLKLTLFHSDLKNEIYYDSITFTNTNIDKSHKYGLELQERHRFNEDLSGHINYTYTKAIIDKEDSGGGAYDGKHLPGVPRHGLSLGIDWRPNSQSSLSLNHTYRSEAYAVNDFANNASQKQAAYNSTDLSYRYHLKKGVELFATVQNLFEESNGIWIDDDQIYPVNFTRNWSIGVKIDSGGGHAY